jgi:outer membrane murein-binding lipoprotein Lpp
MRVLTCLCVLSLFALSAFAASYSCRDSRGRLHITDNLQSLPEDCRASATEAPQEDPDNLHYVPSRRPSPEVSDREFKKQVREVEQELRKKRLKTDELAVRARELAADYQRTVSEKRQALRRWSYQSRDKIRDADERIDRIREEKKQLLTEMETVRMDRDEARQIRADLDTIEED